jgi:hypothetical protein
MTVLHAKQGILPESGFVLQNSALHHTASHTRKTFWVRLSGPLCGALSGHQFEDIKVKEVEHGWLRTHPKRFFMTAS